jgi:hypothetical protein
MVLSRASAESTSPNVFVTSPETHPPTTRCHTPPPPITIHHHNNHHDVRDVHAARVQSHSADHVRSSRTHAGGVAVEKGLRVVPPSVHGHWEAVCELAAAAGVVDVAVTLGSSGDAAVRQHVAMLCASLARVPSLRAALVAAGVIPVLVAMGNQSRASLHHSSRLGPGGAAASGASSVSAFAGGAAAGAGASASAGIALEPRRSVGGVAVVPGRAPASPPRPPRLDGRGVAKDEDENPKPARLSVTRGDSAGAAAAAVAAAVGGAVLGGISAGVKDVAALARVARGGAGAAAVAGAGWATAGTWVHGIRKSFADTLSTFRERHDSLGSTDIEFVEYGDAAVASQLTSPGANMVEILAAVSSCVAELALEGEAACAAIVQSHGVELLIDMLASDVEDVWVKVRRRCAAVAARVIAVHGV